MDIKEKLDELGTAFEAFKKTNDERLSEIKKLGAANPLTEEKLKKNEEHIQKLEVQIETLTKAMNRTGQGADQNDPEAKEKKEAREYKNGFKSFLRKGHDMTAEQKDYAKKYMSVDSDEDGGFFVDADTSKMIITNIFESSPIRQLADTMTISTDHVDMIDDRDEASSGWVGETESRAETGTPQIKQDKIYVHELYASPKTTQKFLDDAAVNVEQWLANKVAEKFARDEATAFMSGSGVKKPKGILSYAATSEGYGKVEVQRTATATGLVGDDFIDVQGLLKEAYQKNASWMINRLNVSKIRKLKDSVSGQYLWQPGLQLGTPNVLLGAPVYYASDLDSTLATDKFTAIYGDFKAGYLVVDRVGVRVLRDPYTNKPFVVFYTTKRVGGGIKQGDALKILQQKAS